MAATAVIVGSPGQTSIIRRSGGPKFQAELSGVLADCGKMHGWLTCHKGVHVGGTAFLASLDPNVVTKARVSQEIERAVSSTYEAIITYYSGCSRQTDGSWGFGRFHNTAQDFLSPAEVFDLIPAERTAMIIVDSSFSGMWVEEAARRRQRVNHKIWVQASCDKWGESIDERAGGLFTRHFLAANHEGLMDNKGAFSGVRYMVNSFQFSGIVSPTCFRSGYGDVLILNNGQVIRTWNDWAAMCT